MRNLIRRDKEISVNIKALMNAPKLLLYCRLFTSNTYPSIHDYSKNKQILLNHGVSGGLNAISVLFLTHI